MIPAGKPVDDTIELLLPNLSEGDILIDGGNSYYKDSMRRGDIWQKGRLILSMSAPRAVSGVLPRDTAL